VIGMNSPANQHELQAQLTSAAWQQHQRHIHHEPTPKRYGLEAFS